MFYFAKEQYPKWGIILVAKIQKNPRNLLGFLEKYQLFCDLFYR